MTAKAAIFGEGSDTVVFVCVKLKAQNSRVLGEREGELDIAVSAPPIDGAANEELVRLLAKCLKIAAGRVAIERGHKSRHKVLRIRDTSMESVRAALLA